MAWISGPHAEAPPDAICYGHHDEPGMVWWFEPEADDPPPPPPPAEEPAHV
jgi:hypothetical protein